MTAVPPAVDGDIAHASTLPAQVYRDPAIHARIVEQVFARSWQLVADLGQVKAPGQTLPLTLLEGSLDEPILLTRDAADRLHCLSNVCTHRGMLVCEAGGVEGALRCRYHGRRFGLDGRFLSMPEFEGVAGFPSSADDLPRLPLERWGPFLFTGIDPAAPFDRVTAPLAERLRGLPLEACGLDATRSRDYLVKANWALYCDNYLEGFHIPYIHAALSGALDYGSYRTELFETGNLQVGVASGDEDVIDLPPDSPDAGTRVAAYYFWLFPNLMVNVYPWGLSLNVVKPLAVDRTRVTFLSYVWDPARLDAGAGAGLDRVEREDEVVVEAVQRGVRSRLYARGRYSVVRESGVHHFHRLLGQWMGWA
jgi:choline monooxygenase